MKYNLLSCFVLLLTLISCSPKQEIKNYSPITIKPRNPEESYYETPKENVPIYNNLKLVIDYSKYDHNNTFQMNEDIFLICKIININNLNIDEEIYLKDHHDYHGTLDYPTSIYLTLEDEHGKKIIDEYTDYIRWSTFFNEMPGDWIRLKQNEIITRKFSINKILGYEYKNIINTGKYYIIITLKYHDKKHETLKKYVSNKLELKIYK